MQEAGDEEGEGELGVAGEEGVGGKAEDGVGEEVGGGGETVTKGLVPEDAVRFTVLLGLFFSTSVRE